MKNVLKLVPESASGLFLRYGLDTADFDRFLELTPDDDGLSCIVTPYQAAQLALQVRIQKLHDVQEGFVDMDPETDVRDLMTAINRLTFACANLGDVWKAQNSGRAVGVCVRERRVNNNIQPAHRLGHRAAYYTYYGRSRTYYLAGMGRADFR